MKIGNLNSSLAFKRALTNEELKEYGKVLQKAKDEISGDGKSILIVHDVCLPQDENSDTGIGHLTSDKSFEFFNFAKNYWGINTVEVLPPGEIQLKSNKKFYNSYNGSALSLGTQQIDLELLTKPEFDSILPVQEFDKVVSANYATKKSDELVNYENVIGENTPYEKALKIAYDNFLLKASDEHKKEFDDYKNENGDWLEKKALYKILKEKNKGKDWEEWPSVLEKNLYKHTNSEKYRARQNELKEKLLNENSEAVDFYSFKQYIADKHLALARQKLNDDNLKIKLIGDCLIGFSKDEVWAYKDAFAKDENGKPVLIGDLIWKIPALDYSTITKEGSASNKLLKKKVEMFAKRYDGIRFDASWNYVTPKLSDGSKYEFKGKILDIIEETVKNVKGDNYNKKDLIHEFEAGPEDFTIMDYSGKVKPYLRDRVKVITEAYMGKDYGSTAAMKKMGAAPDSYVIGVGNHDPQPLMEIAKNIPDIIDGEKLYRKKTQEQTLQDIFGVSEKEVSTPEGFSQYKFADPMLSPNQMIFYMDALGRMERFDSQKNNGENNYRYRIPVDYAKKYQETVQAGFGYSPMDGYSKIFKAVGYDSEKPSLYKQIVKFRDTLKQNDSDSFQTEDNTSMSPKKKKLLAAGTAAAVIALVTAVITGADAGLQDQLQGNKFTIEI